MSSSGAYSILRVRVTTANYALARDRSSYLIESIRSDDAGVVAGARLLFPGERSRGSLKRGKSEASLSSASSVSTSDEALGATAVRVRGG